jgi:hypothetical protein
MSKKIIDHQNVFDFAFKNITNHLITPHSHFKFAIFYIRHILLTVIYFIILEIYNVCNRR